MCIIHTVNNFEDAKKLIDKNPNCIILDVREEEEYAMGHVKDAVLFPVDDITVESAKEVIPSKDSMLVVYCRTGSRSRMAAQTLCKLGYTDIYDIGGLIAWPYGLIMGL